MNIQYCTVFITYQLYRFNCWLFSHSASSRRKRQMIMPFVFESHTRPNAQRSSFRAINSRQRASSWRGAALSSSPTQTGFAFRRAANTRRSRWQWVAMRLGSGCRAMAAAPPACTARSSSASTCATCSARRSPKRRLRVPSRQSRVRAETRTHARDL